MVQVEASDGSGGDLSKANRAPHYQSEITFHHAWRSGGWFCAVCCWFHDTTIFPDLEGLSRTLVTTYRNAPEESPRRGVYVRLKPSRLHGSGIGVFAIRPIAKGMNIFAGENEEIVWMQKAQLRPKGECSACKRFFDNKGRAVWVPDLVQPSDAGVVYQ